MSSSLTQQLAQQITEHIRSNNLNVGAHLGGQKLADLFKVSRAPVLAALKQLAQEGIVVSEKNRGFFLLLNAKELTPHPVQYEDSAEELLYYRLAEDLLSGNLQERVTENELMREYDVPRACLQSALQRAADDLWMERLPGHGWRFLPVLTSQKAYEEGYRFRAAIEPMALLEPGFRANNEALCKLREQQLSIINDTSSQLTRKQLFNMNAEFHEVIVGFSHNHFFLDAVKKVNRVRRLLDYRSTLDRSRLPQQCKEHLRILELLEIGDNKKASEIIKTHLLGALESKRDLVS